MVNKEKPDPSLNQDLTLPQFIQAFGIYKNIMCSACPNLYSRKLGIYKNIMCSACRRSELDLYERDIVDMATRFPGKGFYEYHRMFSAQASAHLSFSNIKIDWSVRNKTLFCNIFTNSKAYTCNLCQSSLHMASFCPKLSDRSFQVWARNSNGQSTVDRWGRARVLINGKELCKNFNTTCGCKRSHCTFLHACLICHKEHSQQDCKDSKNLKTRDEQKPK